jgi:tetratricopeptide (TPR) repeat protein/tRNA A-37 threonylcarbamoyl transferase component Bud32
MPPVSALLPDLSSPDWQAWQPVRDRFETVWRRGVRPQLADYLPPAPRVWQVLDLAAIDLELRLKAGERVRIEDYLGRFPELARHPSVLAELVKVEFEQRRRREAVDPSEYARRFPQLGAESLPVSADRTVKPGAGSAAPVAPHGAPYEILEVLGRGGMGVVYKARDTKLKRLVALKMVLGGAHAGAEELARFRTEAEAVARLQHPNIVQIFEVGEAGGNHYLALEYVEGGSLDRKLNGTPRAPKQSAEIVRTLALALQHAHEHGVIHRDLKPANVLVGKGWVLKVGDFGLARKADASVQTATGAVMGTPSYMAPEQAAGRVNDIGPATDVYALGAILYELLTGRPPFRAATPLDTMMQVIQDEPVPPRTLQSKVPRDLETICLKCLRKAPAKRYGSAGALAADLGRYLERKPIQARPVGGAERVWLWCRRHPAVACFMAVLAGLLAVMTVLAVTSVSGFWYAESNRRRAEKNFKDAEAHRQQAEQNFTDARKTVDEFLTEISSDDLSAIPGLQETRLNFAKRAVARFEEFARKRPDDPEVRLGLAKAHGALGTIVGAIGSLDAAVAALERAVALHARNVQEHPKKWDYAFELAKARLALANLYWEIDQDDDAVPHVNGAFTILEPLAVERPQDVDVKFTLAWACKLRGNTEQRLGNRVPARAAFERSQGLFKEIMATHARKAECLIGLSAAVHNLALECQNEKNYARALELFDLSRNFDNEAAALTPQSPRLLSNYSLGLCNRARVLGLLKRWPEARQDLDKAVQVSRAVVQANPRVTRYRWLLADVLKEYAYFLRSRQEYDASQQAYEESCAILEELTRQADDRPVYGTALIETKLALVDFHQGSKGAGAGKRDDTAYQKAIEEALQTARSLAARYPKARRLVFQFVVALSRRAWWEADNKRDEQALALYDESLDVYTRRIWSFDNRQDPYAVSHLLQIASEAAECAKRLQQKEKVSAIAATAFKVGKDCTNREGIQSLASVLASSGGILQEAKRYREAIEAYQQSLNVARPPLDQATWHWYLRSSVATAYLHLAELYERVGEVENEARARQHYLRVWGGPILGMKTMDYIDPDPAPSAAEAQRLRVFMAKLPGMKRFTVPAEFGGLKYPLHVYISEVPWPKDPLEDQARWLEEERGGTIPEEVRESFRKLHKIAHENNVSFQDLCVYALGTANEAADPKTLKDDKKR